MFRMLIAQPWIMKKRFANETLASVLKAQRASVPILITVRFQTNRPKNMSFSKPAREDKNNINSLTI